LLNSHDQEILLDSLFRIQKSRTLEEAEEPKPEPKEGTTMVLKLTEGHGVIEEHIKALQNEWNKRQATTRQGSVRTLACYKEILKEKKRSWSCQSSVLNFFKSSVLLDLTDNDPDDPPTVHKEFLPSEIFICLPHFKFL
jgi:hypothetical protein